MAISIDPLRPTAIPVAPTPLMRAAIECLGGRKRWQARVSGLFGLMRRRIVIVSEGWYEDGELRFGETLRYSDGQTERREWTVSETEQGLMLEADNVRVIQAGHICGADLIFVYRVQFGRLTYTYRDVFRPAGSGRVENIGYAKLLGIPIMTIRASARTD